NACAYKKVSSPGSTSPVGNVYYDLASTKTLPDDVRSISVHQGWEGYCVEYDASITDPNGNPVCAVWWPVDVPRSGTNIFDNHPEAGFASTAPLYYCVNAASNLIKYTDFGSTAVTGSPLVSGISFVEAKNNTYMLALGEKNGAGRGAAFKNNFQTDLLPLYGETLFGKTGWDNNSDLLRFPVRTESPLAKLHEYDVESIILVVRGQEAGDWPANNEEFVLNRAGVAKSAIGVLPQTSDRWTALWCGGKDDASCDFGGEYSWDKFTPFIVSGDTISCASGTDSISQKKNTNLFAMRARFAGPQGQAPEGFSGTFAPYQFVGIEGGLCDNTPDDGWVDFQAVFQLREWCTTVAQVAVNGESKAWSGRLNNYAHAGVKSGICTGRSPEQGGRGGKYCYTDADCRIGGGICNVLFTVGASPSQGYMSRFFTGDDTFRNQFSFNQDSAPFGSIVPPTQTIFNPTAWDSRADTEEVEKLVGTQVQKEERELEPGIQPLYIEKATGQVRAGTPLACRRGEECILPPTDKGKERPADINEGESGGIALLRNLFAKVFGVWKWNFGSASYESYTPTFGLDFTGGGDAGQCPIVQAVRRAGSGFAPAGWADPTDGGREKFNPSQDSNFYNRSVRPGDIATGFNCPASSGLPLNADAFFGGRYSINGEPIGNVAGTAINDPLVSRIGEEVSLQFYGFNYNGEQLPLREIYIDWNGDTWNRETGAPTGLAGDDTIIAGNFKNRRADCSRTGPNFGQTDRACENAPFEFKHVYQSAGSFSPVVRLKDNWDKHTYAYYNGTVIFVCDSNEGTCTAPPQPAPQQLSILGPDSISVAFNASFDYQIGANRPDVSFEIEYLGVPSGAEPGWIQISNAGRLTGTHTVPGNSGDYLLLIGATHTPTGQKVIKTIGLSAGAPPFSPGWLLRSGSHGSGRYIYT
ncbi:MAG: hypothetical protein HY462_00985, partial [Parcubacteria group bacterium]|nr:hypothetical protein [Parcubacteria group bacterium]